MRRTLAVLIVVAAAFGLVSPADAAETRDWPIDLTCNATTSDDRPALHCAWSAYDGADAYRVVVAVRRRHGVGVRRHRITDTSFTRPVAPGRYNVLIRAVDEDRHPVARSNRVRVVVPRPTS
jgi:hypothetical protein